MKTLDTDTVVDTVVDTVIIGGGLVGGLTALLLEQGGVQATVLDASPILAQEAVFNVQNPRALALTQATINLLKHAQIWQPLLATKRTLYYTGMMAWNNQGYGDILLGKKSDTPFADDCLGIMVEPSILNYVIQQQMLQRIHDCRHQVQVIALDKIIQNGKTIWHIQLENGESLYTSLVIGADGANSFVRQQAMIDLDVLDYQQSVLSCTLLTQEHHQHVARQMYNPTPFALLPMASQQQEQNGYLHSLAWTLPTGDADYYTQCSLDEFEKIVNKASHYMLGKIKVLTAPMAFPLKARSAQRYIDDGLVLIGDAGHTIHPLAGQGMNLGALDAGVLCDVLLHDLQRGYWATTQTLQRYEHQRRGHNLRMMHSMSLMGFMEQFQDTPLRWVLNFGRRIAKSDTLQQFLMQQASGLNQLKNTRYALA